MKSGTVYGSLTVGDIVHLDPRVLPELRIISEEEADESIYWFELMEESGLISAITIAPLKKEATELTAIFTAIGKTAKENQKIKNLKK